MSPRRLRSRARQAREVAAGRAVRELFEQHGRMVHAVCRLRLRDRLDAEDATQQTFLAAYRSLLGGREPVDPPAWLATIARNECSRISKRRIATVATADSERPATDDVAAAVERREEIETLAAALGELTPSQRDAVVLREFYGLSYAEVAAALGVSGPAVESLLFKGRRRLQDKLASLGVASVAVLPHTVRDALVQILPGFGGGAAAAAGSKTLAAPAVAKVAALALVATGGGVTVAETVRSDAPRGVPGADESAAGLAPPLAIPERDPRVRIASTRRTTRTAERRRPEALSAAPRDGDEREIAGRREEEEIATAKGDDAAAHEKHEDRGEIAEQPRGDELDDDFESAGIDVRRESGAAVPGGEDEDETEDEEEDGHEDEDSGGDDTLDD